MTTYFIAVLVFVVNIVNAVKFDACEQPANNSQRIQWMNQMVVDVQTLLKDHNITTWISQGTLLGSVRNNKTLPWTGDVDVHMFYNEMKPICNTSSRLGQAFRKINLRVYDCKKDFIRICYANISMKSPPQFAELDKYSPQAILELYGCQQRSDGLYTIPNNRCIWNFTGLFPLKKYHLGNGTYALGPNKPNYWLEQYYGKDWRRPNVYAGDKYLPNICVGKYDE